MEPLSTLSTTKSPQIPQLLSKDLIKGPQRGAKGSYFLLTLLTNTKIGRDAHTRMFQGLAEE
jgi:hypothetical protein